MKGKTPPDNRPEDGRSGRWFSSEILYSPTMAFSATAGTRPEFLYHQDGRFQAQHPGSQTCRVPWGAGRKYRPGLDQGAEPLLKGELRLRTWYTRAKFSQRTVR
jgi:hypothetical protein